MISAHCNHLETMRLLLDAGANLRIGDAAGRTAQVIAVAEGHQDAVATLEQHAEILKRASEQNARAEILSELEELPAVQSERFVAADAIDKMVAQCASLSNGDEGTVLTSAVRLQQQCKLLVDELIPARRKAAELLALDVQIDELEVSPERKRERAARESAQKAYDERASGVLHHSSALRIPRGEKRGRVDGGSPS